jgi:hypothetical protein
MFAVGHFGLAIRGETSDTRGKERGGMRGKAAITVLRGTEEVERLWRSPEYPTKNVDRANATVTFIRAPGGRGTEIHVELQSGGGKMAAFLRSLTMTPRLATIKDDLRKFKQLVETGEIARSDAMPEGESVLRKFRQRPAQPLDTSQPEKVGA